MGEGFPLNLPRLLLFSPQPDTPPEEAANAFLQLPECRQMAALILVIDPQQRRSLAKLIKDSSAMWVIPGSQEITALLLASRPAEHLAQVLANHIHVGRISPYQTREGVEKESGFFGRKQILADIINRSPRNYLLVGGRQLGKSSLLKALKRAYEQRPGVVCSYLAASQSDISQPLAMALDLPPTATMETVLQTLATLPVGGERIFLVDEVDTFVAWDEKQGYKILHQFRNLSAEKRCHFIMAGFWGLYQRTVDYHSPLKNFGETCLIGALEEEACRQMATQPMALLGIGYENPALVEDLIAQTGGRANLIAIACNHVLNHLNMTTRTIGPDLVKKALDSNDILNALGGWQEMNGKEEPQANRLDRILVYLAADRQEITLAEIQRELTALGIPTAPEAIKASLTRLELAFVLNRQENRYRHQVPLLRNMLFADSPRQLIAGELTQASYGTIDDP